jgi:FkbM family methyltransferase
VFDIGAYCGVSTQLFSKLVGPEGRVYAFEPDPLNHQLLVRNIRRHNMENVIPLQLAVSDRTGVEFFNNEGSLGSGIAAHMSRASAGKPIRVEAVCFEEACARYSVPNLVKIDIEGAEIAMLDAARTFITRHQIFFALDTNHRINGRLTASKVEEIFQSSGYHVASSDSSGFMTTLAGPSSEPVVPGASQ